MKTPSEYKEIWKGDKRLMNDDQFDELLTQRIQEIQRDAFAAGQAKGEADTKMLNWLESNLDRLKIECNLANEEAPFWFEKINGEFMCGGLTLREAINKGRVIYPFPQ